MVSHEICTTFSLWRSNKRSTAYLVLFFSNFICIVWINFAVSHTLRCTSTTPNWEELESSSVVRHLCSVAWALSLSLYASFNFKCTSTNCSAGSLHYHSFHKLKPWQHCIFQESFSQHCIFQESYFKNHSQRRSLVQKVIKWVTFCSTSN
jgi:hypothetical protein